MHDYQGVRVGVTLTPALKDLVIEFTPSYYRIEELELKEPRSLNGREKTRLRQRKWYMSRKLADTSFYLFL